MDPETLNPILFYGGFFVLLGLSVYFFSYKPKKKQQEQQKKTLESIKKGDHVVTIGGIFATVEGVTEDYFLIKVESGALLKVAKFAIAGKGTEASAESRK